MTDELKTEGIHEFLLKYKNARSFNSKEIRLTIEEADRLNSGIALLLSQYQILADQVIELQQEILEPTEITMSGGTFTE